MDKSFILAYHQINQSLAQELARHLGVAGYQFDHLSKDDQSTESLSEALNRDNRQVLLVLSDNFLKTVSCMQQGLNMLQQLTNSNRLFAVIVDGLSLQSETGQYHAVPTRFERVSDVIQYMNFWQNEYLELRKEKKTSHPEEEAFKERLRIVRSISSEIGEFLRQLRGEEYHHFDNLMEQQMRPFFDFTKDQAGQTTYLAALPLQPAGQASQQPPSYPQEETLDLGQEAPVSQGEAPKQQSEDPTVPNPTSEISGEQVEEPPVPIMEIPGMDQLAENEEAFAPEILEDDLHPVPDLEVSEDQSSLLSQVVRYEKEKDLERENHQKTEEHLFFHDEEMEDRGQMQEEEPEHPQIEEPAPREEDNISIWEEDFDDEPSSPLEKSAFLDKDLDDLFDLEDDDDDDDEDEDELEERSANVRSLEPGDNQKTYIHPDQLLEHAQGLLANQMIDAGLKVLLDGTQIFSEDPSIRYEYALALIKYRENNQDAAYQLREALLLDEEHVASLFLLGELSEIDDELEIAEQLYDRVLQLQGDFPGANKRLAVVLQKQQKGDPQRLVSLYKQALKENKYDSESRYHYAVLLVEAMDQPEKAAKHFKKTLKYKPDHPFASYDLALYYHREGKYEKAQKYYQQAVLINPELQTPQNDAAFIIPEEPVPPVSLATEIEDHTEQPTQRHLTDTVLITGATSGIGRATALEFAQKGYQLILTGRREDRLEALKAELSAAFGVNITLLSFDVRDPEACQRAIDTLNDQEIQVDILINNAGLAMGLDSIHEGDLFHWDTMVDTNIKGLLYMTRLLSPGMVERRQGHIINICSTAGKEVYPKGNVYCATKHAVDALTRAMRLDLAEHNIRVSQVAPAMVEETEFAIVRFEGDEEKANIYEDFQPLKAKDVAETIYFIATRPPHVNIQDVVLLGTQQASSTQIHRTGR